MKTLIMPFMVLAFTVGFAAWYAIPSVSSATGVYAITADSVNMWDVDISSWSGPTGNCGSIQCAGPGDVGNSCYSNSPTPGWTNVCYMGDTGNCGNLQHTDYSCKGFCTPDNSCAATTCNTTTCSDGCSGQVAGTKVCALPPPSCTPDTSCAANTCTSSTCAATAGDCSTYPIAGTMVCAVPAPVPPAPVPVPPAPVPPAPVPVPPAPVPVPPAPVPVPPAPVPVPPAPPPCSGGASVSITASPTLVNSGGTANFTITGSAIASSCTISGPGVSPTSINPSSCSLSASATATGITTQSTYTVTCPGATASVVVNVTPKFKEF